MVPAGDVSGRDLPLLAGKVCRKQVAVFVLYICVGHDRLVDGVYSHGEVTIWL